MDIDQALRPTVVREKREKRATSRVRSVQNEVFFEGNMVSLVYTDKKASRCYRDTDGKAATLSI